MYDPMTVAFEIKWPFGGRESGVRATKNAKKHKYYSRLITIWHKDPEKKNGRDVRGDDTCGWFMRSGHGDPAVIKSIEHDFAFEWCNSWGGWFNEDGTPHLSVGAITRNMFSIAAYHHLGSWERANKFMKKHLYDILCFSENNIDSMHSTITGRYGIPEKEDRIKSCTSIIYGCVLRWSRPWYKHPRWHVHHWRIQFHPWQYLRRRFWDKCCKCGKRGFPKGVSAMGDWNGTRIWHSTCDGSIDTSALPESQNPIKD